MKPWADGISRRSNIDLAGQDEPRGRGSDVRVMREVTPPRIKLRYPLSSGGRRMTSGEEI